MAMPGRRHVFGTRAGAMRLLGMACGALLVSPACGAETGQTTPDETLRQAIEYLRAGDLARARIAFESVLLIDNLPRDIGHVDDVYAAEAEARLAGRSVTGAAYGVASAGIYREKATAAGIGDGSDFFGGLRAGGRVNAVLSPSLTVNAAVDYRYRAYDNADRRDDSDLRWNLSGSRTLGDNNLRFGLRGWASYRGNGITRHDYGVYTAFRLRAGPDDQIEIGAELRRRHYPRGPLRERSRDIAEASTQWSHAMGKASFSIAARGGREFATSDRPDGDSNFFGLSPSLDVTIADKVTAYAYLWWQNDRYHAEKHESDSAAGGAAIGTRNDDLVEIGAGLAWAFAPGWEAGPSVVYPRDFSNVVTANYSSVEMLVSLRRDF